MDATKAHLLLNYCPLIGTIIGLFLLLYGKWRSSVRAQMISLGMLLLTAIVTLAAFGTGEAAGKGAEYMVGQVWTNILQHKTSALPAFAVIESMGIFALFGLINLIRRQALAGWFVITVVVLSLASLGLTARTVLLGRHIYSVEQPIS